MHIPELVSPAGNWSSLKSAVSSGCDSVYFGVKGLNMRHGAGNFDLLEIKKIMKYLHDNSKKGYLALNVIIYEKDLKLVKKILLEAKKAQVDAVVLWDHAVLMMAKELGLNIHLSTQASVSNYEALKSYASLGVKRVVLARECSLSDIKKIIKNKRKDALDCGIEIFIHGAMCVSVSGRCFMSELTFGKSANRGECLQPCRREYKIIDMDSEAEYVLGEDYVLSPKDLCSVEIIDELIDAGIDAFKIEGRIRSSEYVKVVTKVYREAIDSHSNKTLDAKKKKDFKEELIQVYNRGFSKGFYEGKPAGWISKGMGHKKEKVYIIKKYFNKIEVAEILVQNTGLKINDEVIVTGDKTEAFVFKVNRIEKDHIKIKLAVKGEKVAVKVPGRVRAGDKIYKWVSVSHSE
ncbi:MAG: U32 family peptidase [Candidatus Omnitrophica bacterium]|nr:U32 family peptidase [Candidatus Omnitrophota bacterium]